MANGSEHADMDAISRQVLERQETFERADATAGDHDMWGHCHTLALAPQDTHRRSSTSARGKTRRCLRVFCGRQRVR